MRDLLRSGNYSNLIQRSDLRAQAPVHAEDFAVDDGGKGKEIEDLTARFPDRSVAVLLLAFFVEAVDLRYLPGFVVPAHESDFVWVSRGYGSARLFQDWRCSATHTSLSNT